MMEPRFELASVLAEAVGVGARALEHPIDTVTVSRDRIFISAGGERLELSYTYHNAYTQDGSVMPGSGHWSVSIVRQTKGNRFAAIVRAAVRKITFSDRSKQS